MANMKLKADEDGKKSPSAVVILDVSQKTPQASVASNILKLSTQMDMVEKIATDY